MSCLYCLVMYSSSNVSYACSRADDGAETSNFQFHLGPLTVGWNELYVGFMTIILVYPVTLVIAELFRKSKHISSRKILTALNEDVSPENANKDRTLPSCTRGVAWFLVIFAVVSSACVVFLYSLEWGGDKAKEWLGAFVMSFVQAVFLLDPFVVCVKSIYTQLLAMSVVFFIH